MIEATHKMQFTDAVLMFMDNLNAQNVFRLRWHTVWFFPEFANCGQPCKKIYIYTVRMGMQLSRSISIL